MNFTNYQSFLFTVCFAIPFYFFRVPVSCSFPDFWLFCPFQLQDLESELNCLLFVLRYFYLYLDVIFLYLHHLQLTLDIRNYLVHLLHLAHHKFIYMGLIYPFLRSDYLQCLDHLFPSDYYNLSLFLSFRGS